MDIGGLVHLVIYLIGIGCILGLLLYLVSISPVPEPWKSWLRFTVIFFAVVILIFVILNVIGATPRLRMSGAPASFTHAVSQPLAPNQFNVFYHQL